MERFLVQVNESYGYPLVTGNLKYENNAWTNKPRDSEHGQVKPGDELLIYCTRNVPRYGKTLAFSVPVIEVSEDKVSFELGEPHWFPSPLGRDELHNLVDKGEIPDTFRKCGQQGFNIARLDPLGAQKVVDLAENTQILSTWEWPIWPKDVVHDEPNTSDLSPLAQELTLPVSFLKEIRTLLEEKLQIIFQGPPGTGKTFVAQKLARHLAGSEDQITLVQFHPSYAYEDFVHGFRPTVPENGQLGFELTLGPLLKAADDARNEPNAKYFLIIDEINRGNLARILGELYFLLEYRDEKISLQYQGDTKEKFSLPDNLYIIGTMNTADRSIALVDLALRRRFYFVEFHPDHEPIKNVLRNWLNAKAPSMEWVAKVVEAANQKLRDDRHAAIGPSYFMKPGLDEAKVRLIWKHSVLPYIEERLFGDDDRIREFDLDRLRAQVTSGLQPNTGDQDENVAQDGDDAE